MGIPWQCHVPCQAGLSARDTNTNLAGSRCRDQGLKGVFIPWPFKFAAGLGKLQFSSFTSISSIGVFKGTPPTKGHFASIWLGSSETLVLPKGKPTAFKENIDTITFFYRCHSQEQLHHLAQMCLDKFSLSSSDCLEKFSVNIKAKNDGKEELQV